MTTSTARVNVSESLAPTFDLDEVRAKIDEIFQRVEDIFLMKYPTVSNSTRMNGVFRTVLNELEENLIQSVLQIEDFSQFESMSKRIYQKVLELKKKTDESKKVQAMLLHFCCDFVEYHEKELKHCD